MKTILPRTRGAAALTLLFCFLFGGGARATLIDNYSALTNAIAASPAVTGFLNGTIIPVLPGEAIAITRDTVIDAGSANVILDGQNLTRLFNVRPGAQLTLANLALTRGYATFGGAVYNQGTLVVSNCVFYNNNVTNAPGLAGANGATNGFNGGIGGDGGNVWGAAIYSVGPLYVYNSLFSTNLALAGAGGSGGSGVNVTGQAPAGYGGAGGSGGSAEGGAIFSAGDTNVIFDSEFLGNTCVAGQGGNGGVEGINSQFYYDDGESGQGGAGGPAIGGGVYVTGALAVSNSVFWNNAAFAGASMAAAGAFNGAGNNGAPGGAAAGGGLYVLSSSPSAGIENSVFFENACVAGAGASASATGSHGGNGGSATGGGVSSGSTATFIQNCTLATNTLLAGAAGGDSGTNGVNGTVGAANGPEVFRGAGTSRIQNSLMAGAGGNSYSVSDAGYNISSDATPGRIYPTTTLRTDPRIATGLSTNGGANIGPAGANYPRLSLAIVQGSPAAGALPGVPGVSFPATDQRGEARPAKASIGAYEANILPVTPTAAPEITQQPTDQSAALGRSISLRVAATGNGDDTNALGYQWQLNGVNLIESATVLNVHTPTLTLLKLTQAELGAYTVVVSPSVLDSEVVSDPAYLLVDLPIVVKQQPASRLNAPNGSVVQFKVNVTGAPPFSYQWLMNGSPMTDGGEFSGTATSNLTINPATFSDEASYQVVVTSSSRTTTSKAARLTVVNDNAKPRLTITAPAVNARTLNGVVAGYAFDNAQVTSVNLWVTNVFEGVSTVTETNAAITGAGTTETWAVSNIFSPGSNIVAVQGVDFAGNSSAWVTRRFFYAAPSYFSLVIQGNGTVTGRTTVPGTDAPADGAMLNIGQNYVLTAKPGAEYLLTNWTSADFTASASTVVFTMTPGLSISANFVLSPFLSAPGPYNGLFFDTNGVTTQTAGMLSNLKVGPLGAYSGKLLLGGVAYPLAGTFNIYGAATNHLARAAAKGGAFEVTLNLDWTSGQVNGAVSAANGSWEAPLYGEASTTAAASGESTMLLTVSDNGVGTAPSAEGYVLMTNRAGNLTLSGAMPDGTAFAQSVPLGKYGNAPLYQSFSGGGGLVLGWVNLTDRLPVASDGLTWIRPAGTARAVFYPGGFTNVLSAAGSPWVNNIAAAGSLLVSNESVDVPYQVSIADDLVEDSADDPAVKGTINPKTGLITLKIPSGRGTITGYAAILANSTNIGGYFLTKTNTGIISFQP